MSPALSQALEQIEAIGASERAYQARLAADRRYQFLLATSVATRVEFSDSDYGRAGFARIVSHQGSAAQLRHKRAVELMLARKLKLFNGSREKAKERLANCADLRAIEIPRRHIEACDRNLAGVDAALARMGAAA